MAPRFDSVRTSYDTVAVDYDELVADELADKPLERAMLAAFAQLVAADGGRPIADIGCGTGRVTAHLHALGVPVFGIDLSPGMVDVARRTCPELRFEVGSMTEIDLPAGGLGGILAWRSIVHMPLRELSAVFTEFHRVLGPDGILLLAFKVGDDSVHLEQAYGHPVSLEVHRHPPDAVSDLAHRAGLVEVARLVREPDPPEKTPQAFLILRKPRDVSA